MGRGEEIKKKKGEVIDARCHCKQNGKYNLAFSLCGDNGANACRRHGREQTAWLVIRQERFGAMGRRRLGRGERRGMMGVGGVDAEAGN